MMFLLFRSMPLLQRHALPNMALSWLTLRSRHLRMVGGEDDES